MEIYGTDGELIINAPVTSSALIKNMLMGDCYIELPFSLREQAMFPRGSYIMYNGLKYKIKESVSPDFDSNTGGYKYTLRFWSRQNDMKDAVVFWQGGSVRETSFHDTTDLGSFGSLIAASMNSFEGNTSWKAAAVPSEFEKTTKLVSFNGDSCWDGINLIAETFDVEWWVVENGEEVWIYFGKLEFGTEEVFKRGDAVQSIPARKGDDSNYGTRFYAFGATRNIPDGYYEEQSGNVTNHVSERRLHLPNGLSYVDAWSPLQHDDIIEQVVFFEDIYPKNTETVTSVSTIQRQIEGTDDSSATFDAYVMYCKDTPFLPSDIFAGETLQCVFTSGSLNGREFELALIKDDNAHSVIDPGTWKQEDGFNKKFEIIADQEDAGGDIPLIIPNAQLHPEAGDTFVLTGVNLPQKRIEEAEQELLEAATEWAVKNSSDTDVYECPTNPVFCANNDKNYELGQKVLLVDDRFGKTGRSSRIQGYEKKLYNIYDATYTVGDNTAYSRLGSIEKNITEAAYTERIGVYNGMGIYLIRSKYDTTQPSDSNAYSALASASRFLNRLTGGKISGDVAFGGDLTSADYSEGGLEGAGFGLIKGSDGSYTLEIDKINVRKEAVFHELVINQITFTAGETIFSAGGCEISHVEELEDAYRCHYDNKAGRRYSGLVSGDQVRCQRYDAARQSIVKYYWRLVVAVGDDYVDVSKTDCDGEGVPEEGDNLVQFGNRTDIGRQSAIAINPLDAGSVVVVAHVNSYSLINRQFVGFGVDNSSGDGYIFGYGDMYFGDRDREDTGSTYIAYEKVNGKRVVSIKGKMVFTSGSSGLENMEEWPGKQGQIDAAGEAAQEAREAAVLAKAAAETLDTRISDVETGMLESVEELNRRLDGVVENWFEEGAPTEDNPNNPALQWTTDTEKQNHLGDTYTDIQEYDESDTLTYTAGQSWRWTYTDTEHTGYHWHKIADSDAVKALVDAANAQATADGKSRTFVSTPYPPYDVGDLWAQGPDGEMMRCVNARPSGNFTSSDWERAVKYTDDTLAKEAKEAAAAAKSAADAAQSVADAAQSAADEAQQAADEAKTAADSAQLEAGQAREDAEEASRTLSDWASDSMVSPPEQKELANLLAQVRAEFTQINRDAVRYNLTTAQKNAYSTAYNAALAALTKYSTPTQDGSSIAVGSDYADITAYFTARATILDLIAQAAKAEAEAAQEAADAAQGEAESAQRAAADASTLARQAKALADTASTDAAAAKSSADQAQALASAAQDAADEAKAAASTAQDMAADAAAAAADAKDTADRAAADLAEWASDGIFSPVEKQALRNEKAQIEADHADILNQTSRYSVNNETALWNTYDNAYDSYWALLDAVTETEDAVAVPSGFAAAQQAYYSARTSILDAISVAAKAAADAAQAAADAAQDAADEAKEAADEAKAAADSAMDEAQAAKIAADAAKQATDNLNDDLVFSLTEKRSVRARLKEISPAEDGEPETLAYTLTGRTATSGNAWTEVTDEADANYGWWQSNMHTASGSTVTTLTFSVRYRCGITVHIMSRAEGSYDYVRLGKMDASDLTSTSLTESQKDTASVLTTKGKQGQDLVYTFKDVAPGTHTVMVQYRKDISGDTSPDNGYYMVDRQVYAEGSLGDWYGMTMEHGNGFDASHGDPAYDAAYDLFSYLHETGQVWTDADTPVPAGFRDQVYSLFCAYYAKIAAIISDMPLDAMSDLDYLKAALPDASTVIDGGVVLTSVIGVVNPDEPSKVLAFMNGSDDITGLVDGEHGVLMFAAGVPDGTLADQAQNAATRIYADGHLFSRSAEIEGRITATSGVIGGFSIGAGQLEAEYWSGASTPVLETTTTLRPEYIRFRDHRRGVDAFFGTRTVSAAAGVNPVIRVEADNSLVTGITGIYLDIKTTLSNAYSVYCPSGMFAGLRPYTRRVTATVTLEDTDCVVLVAASSAITITLPSSPQPGQMYILRNISSGSYTLQVGNTAHRINYNKNGGATSWGHTSGALVTVIWDDTGKSWIGNYTNVIS